VDETPALRERFLERDGCEIALEVLEGDANGAPGDRSLVLVHGFGTSRRTVRPLARALLGGPPDIAGAARHTRAVLVDLRGHGATRTAPGAAFTYDAMRDDLLAVLAAECPHGADVVGHSMGGQIALMAAQGEPDAIRSLVTIGAGPCREITDDRERKSWERAAGFFERAEGGALAAALADAAPADAEANPELSPERLYADARGQDLAQVIRTGFFEVKTDDDACRTLHVPTLVLVGARDEGWLEPSRKLAALVPGSSLTVIEGGGHWIHVEAARETTREIRAFLDALPRD
jgi:pimeloyl-ACP methyl ester carboxylesterase